MEKYQKIARLGNNIGWNEKKWIFRSFSVPDVDENLAPKGDIVEDFATNGEIAKIFCLTVEEIADYLGKKGKIDITGMSPEQLKSIASDLGKDIKKKGGSYARY